MPANIKTKILMLCTLISFTSVLSARYNNNGISTSSVAQAKPLAISTRADCSDRQIKRYVAKLGKPGLKRFEFKALVDCGSQSISNLKTALKSKDSNVRAGAAYALGEIGISTQDWDVMDIIEAYQTSETDSNVRHILQSYQVVVTGCMNCAPSPELVRKVQSQTSLSSPIACKLPGIRRIFPRC